MRSQERAALGLVKVPRVNLWFRVFIFGAMAVLFTEPHEA
jgi:hypothetical protein